MSKNAIKGVFSHIRLYYRFLEFDYLSKVKSKAVETESSENVEDDSIVGKSLNDAIAAYRKIKVGKLELSEKELATLDKECKVIEDRETVEYDTVHEPQEIETEGKGKIQMGPPTLTRFEKARIMGARALQLSLGAPPFIEIPETARTSLDIALVELEKRVIPIVIRRSLPNGDYQNIPISVFD